MRLRWPIGTLLLSSSLVAAFIIDDATRVHRGVGPVLLPALWVLDGLDPKPWQFFSYVFVHGFRAHLLGNLLVLVPASLACEWKLGAPRLVASFVGLAAFVGVGFHAFDSRDLYGASGVGAALLSMMAVLWSCAAELPLWRRLVPVVVTLGYFGFVEVWPALQGRASAGVLAHSLGALGGVALGRWFSAPGLFRARTRPTSSARSAPER